MYLPVVALAVCYIVLPFSLCAVSDLMIIHKCALGWERGIKGANYTLQSVEMHNRIENGKAKFEKSMTVHAWTYM